MKISDRLSQSQYLRMLLIFIIIIPTGIYTKFYNGPGEFWVANSLSDVLYEVFWCLALFFVFPKMNPVKIGLVVFIATSLIEISQLWNCGFLESIRKTFIGKMLLGTTFVWSDFIYYAIGCLAGWTLLKWLKKIK